MNKAEVAELMKVIKRTYPSFDASAESVNHHFKYLQDFPFQAAQENVDQHILTERFPPIIADIRGRIGDQLDSQRSKEEADSYFAQFELFLQGSAPPPAGNMDRIRQMCRGQANDVHG
ncbi:MAG: hypothetical protein JWR03_2605 [Cohnella sp.]|nr:hypothetical protein [Cohnella sp.]